MRVGLVARSNARGLGSQTYEAWRGYPFDSVLHVLDNNGRWPENPRLYPGAHVVRWVPGQAFDHEPLIEFMAGLDVIFSVETLYDWSLVHMANNRNIRTIVQANPEFMRHQREDGQWPLTPHPTMWVFPTEWMIGHMPSHRILPVPVPVTVGAKAAEADAPFVIVHPAGHRAAGDRNGSDLVVEALRMIQTQVTVRIVGQDGPNTIFREQAPLLGPNVTLELIETGVEDKWSIYDGAHVALLPRRYGGLCLPAIEAAACGVIPMMPDVIPNTRWPIEILPWAIGRAQLTPYGMVETASTNPLHIAHRIDDLNRTRSYVAEKQEQCLAWAAENSWDRLRPEYDDVFSSRPV